MRLAIFLRIYTIPVLLALFLIIEFVSGYTPFKLFLHITFLVAVLLAILLDDKKYIQRFTIIDGHIEIGFRTQFLHRKSSELAIAGIMEANLVHQGLFGLWPAILKIKYNGEWLTFQVLNRKLINEIQNLLESAGIAATRKGFS